MLKPVLVPLIIVFEGLVDQRKIASLAWRRPRVQIPTSPYFKFDTYKDCFIKIDFIRELDSPPTKKKIKNEAIKGIK